MAKRARRANVRRRFDWEGSAEHARRGSLLIAVILSLQCTGCMHVDYASSEPTFIPGEDPVRVAVCDLTRQKASIASIGDTLFSNTAPSRRILRRRLSDSAWSIEPRTNVPASSLSSDGVSLFFVAAANAAVYRMDPNSTPVMLYSGQPLRCPVGIAATPHHLFILESDGQIFVMHHEAERPTGLLYGGRMLSRGEVRIAASGSEVANDSDAASGSEARSTLAILNRQLSALITIELSPVRGVGFSFVNLGRLEGRTNGALKDPSSLAMYHDLIYVGDRADSGSLTTFVAGTGAFPLSIDASELGDAAAADQHHLYQVNWAGQLSIRDRPAPVDLSVPVGELSADEVSTRVAEALAKENTLPFSTRGGDRSTGPWSTGEWKLPRWSRESERVQRLYCASQRNSCAGEQLERDPIAEPFLPYVDTIELRPVSLSRGKTLGQEARERLPSDELRQQYGDIDAIAAVNKSVLAKRRLGASAILATTSGDFLLYTKVIRFRTILPSDVAARDDLGFLIPEARAAEVRPDGLRPQRTGLPGADADIAAAQAAFEALKEAVHYEGVPDDRLDPAIVGLIGETVDCSSNSLLRADKSSVCAKTLALAANAAQVQLAAAAAANLHGMGAGNIKSFLQAVNDLQKALNSLPIASAAAGHGNMVAALIAGTNLGFGAQGLAPSSLIVPLDDKVEAKSLSALISDAFAIYRARIFNVSQASSDQTAIAENLISQTAPGLYVVAAGNKQGEICSDYVSYPACFGNAENVLVVGAVDVGRRQWIGGWGNKFVHVAAPGSGFSVTGGNGLVQADGTSFATPIVTAAAALLYSAHVTDAGAIKRRLIATADYLPEFADKVLGGVVNFRRALYAPRYSVLISAQNGEPETGVVMASCRGQEIPGCVPERPSFSTTQVTSHGDEQYVLDMDRLLRSTKDAVRQQFRIVEEVDGKVVVRRVRIPAAGRAWRFRIQLYDTGSGKPLRTVDRYLDDLEDYVGPIR